MAVFGGLKTPNLFVTWKEKLEPGDDIKDLVMYEITDMIGAKAIKPAKRQEVIQKGTQNWHGIRAKNIAEKILKENVTLTDIQSEGSKLLYLSKEEREDNEYAPN